MLQCCFWSTAQHAFTPWEKNQQYSSQGWWLRPVKSHAFRVRLTHFDPEMSLTPANLTRLLHLLKVGSQVYQNPKRMLWGLGLVAVALLRVYYVACPSVDDYFPSIHSWLELCWPLMTIHCKLFANPVQYEIHYKWCSASWWLDDKSIFIRQPSPSKLL